MILLWGLPGDRSMAAVYAALKRARCKVVLFDQRRLIESEVELSVGPDVDGELCIPSNTIRLSAVTSVYARPYDSRRLPFIAHAGPESAAWRHALAVDDILTAWAELTPALVVNRPSAMAANASKPYQATLIEHLGFRIPETLITSDPDAALEFWLRHEEVVYKSLSGVRSIVSRLTPEHQRRFADIKSCPTQFQQYISGTEYRIHVVGSEVFACRIMSKADDYRYAADWGLTVTIEPWDLPEDVRARCTALAKSLDLVVAGIDLRRTPQGAWYCFEVNPSPGFVYFQEATGQPIDESIARVLMLQ